MEYKMRHVERWLKFNYNGYNGFLLDCDFRSKASLWEAKLKFQYSKCLFCSVSSGIQIKAWCRSVKISVEVMKCMWKFAADSKVRPAKLSINKKRVIKCAGV